MYWVHWPHDVLHEPSSLLRLLRDSGLDFLLERPGRFDRVYIPPPILAVRGLVGVDFGSVARRGRPWCLGPRVA